MREGITPAEALRIVLAETPVLPAETVEAREALGRVLAEPVGAGRRIPPAYNSAMDGFALRAEDVAEVPTELRVVLDLPAGRRTDRKRGPGGAAGR